MLLGERLEIKFFALATKRTGFEVMVCEKDLTAIIGVGQYRGSTC